MNPRLSARPIIFAVLVAAAALAHRPAAAPVPTLAQVCAASGAGYVAGELHAYGQSYEAGFGPTQTPVVIVQHEDRGVTPTTYIPYLACTRALTKAEQDAVNAGLSVPPSNWPAR